MVEGGVEVEGGDDLSPWPHLGTAKDVAKLAMYLASDDAEMVTGSMQVLDGGYTVGEGVEAPQG
jgi:enoyl-[acyl-carrier-protein] reductase (NADH)